MLHRVGTLCCGAGALSLNWTFSLGLTIHPINVVNTVQQAQPMRKHYIVQYRYFKLVIRKAKAEWFLATSTYTGLNKLNIITYLTIPTFTFTPFLKHVKFSDKLIYSDIKGQCAAWQPSISWTPASCLWRICTSPGHTGTGHLPSKVGLSLSFLQISGSNVRQDMEKNFERRTLLLGNRWKCFIN